VEVRDIAKERCTLVGIEGRFSAHSLRAGFVTEAGRQAMSLPETMAMTGHHSVATVIGYCALKARSTARPAGCTLRIDMNICGAWAKEAGLLLPGGARNRMPYYARSNTAAMPCPPPMHIVTSA
jgi:hypothetical protein